MDASTTTARLAARLDEVEATLSTRLDRLEQELTTFRADTAPAAQGPATVPSHAPPGAVPSQAPPGAMPPPPIAPAPGLLPPHPGSPPPPGPPPFGPGAGPRTGSGPGGAGPGRPATARPSARPSAPDIGLEAVLRWVGLLLVSLAAVFLVSTAITRGWIGPELQLLGAALIGLSMTAAATWLVDDRRPWAVGLANAGAFVVGMAAAAAHEWLGLVGAGPGLLLAAVAAAFSLLVAARLDMGSVAATTAAVALIVPVWMQAPVELPLTATGAWYVSIAVVGLVVGLRHGWPAVRLVAGIGAALSLLALAASMEGEASSVELAGGVGAAGLVGFALWIGPVLAWAGDRRAGGEARNGSGGVNDPMASLTGALRGVETRSLVGLPLWSWATVSLLTDLGDVTAGRVGLALAAGLGAVALAIAFIDPVAGRLIAVADAVARVIGRRPAGGGTGAGPSPVDGVRAVLPSAIPVGHLLGAGVLLSVSVVVLFEGSALAVALMAQAIATSALARLAASSEPDPATGAEPLTGPATADRIGRWSESLILDIQSLVLAASAWLIVVEGMVDTIERSRYSLGDLAGHAAATVLGLGFAWLIRRRPIDRFVTEAAAAAAWSLLFGLAASLLAPLGGGGHGTVLLITGYAVVSIVAGRRLGPGVLSVGASFALLALGLGAIGTIDTLAAGGAGPIGHLADLAPLLLLWAVVVWRRLDDQNGRNAEANGGADGRPLAGNADGRPLAGDAAPGPAFPFPPFNLLFAGAWLWTLGFVASLLVGATQGQVAVSLIWAVMAIGALLAGIRWDDGAIRTVGLVTLGVVVVKLLTIDLAAVDTLWRVGLFLVVGLGLLRLGYVLPRLVDRYGRSADPERPDPERPDPAEGWSESGVS